jgi:hypothetical protein
VARSGLSVTVQKSQDMYNKLERCNDVERQNLLQMCERKKRSPVFYCKMKWTGLEKNRAYSLLFKKREKWTSKV